MTPVLHLFAELIYVTFATHPDAVRMIDRAIDPGGVTILTTPFPTLPLPATLPPHP